MAKGIEIHGGGGVAVKMLLEVTLSRVDLSDKAFAAWDITVRLQIPPAHDVPAPLGHKALNAFEKRGFVDPAILVQQDFVVIENKIVILFANIGGHPVCGYGLYDTFFEFPKINGV